MTTINPIKRESVFKKTTYEKSEIKRIKKDWLRNLKKLDPKITKSTAVFGFRSNDLRQLNVLLDLANKATSLMN